MIHKAEYSLTMLSNPSDQAPYDGVVVAVNHREFQELGIVGLSKLTNTHAVISDVKGMFDTHAVGGSGLTFWRL